ncbi:MAG: phage antirepressor N-terminal domain-containing protein [Candidatus Methylomirabilis oxyfera]|nr:phage antirepressor N-terminal domain-containing protein [Candidatus Methylomirabilis oxyfera]
MPTNTLIPVPFHGCTLFVIDINGEPYVVMRTIVEALGLDWAGQYAKLMTQRERWGVEITQLPSPGGPQSTVVMPLRKFSGWINSLNINKVHNDVRHKIAMFQRESDDALWNYWNKGYAHNSRILAPDPAVAKVLALDGMQILLVHEAQAGLVATAAAAEALLGRPRGTIRKLTKRDPVVKEHYHLLCGDRLDIFKRALGLPASINIKAAITVEGLEHMAGRPEAGPQGKRVLKLLRRRPALPGSKAS